MGRKIPRLSLWDYGFRDPTGIAVGNARVCVSHRRVTDCRKHGGALIPADQALPEGAERRDAKIGDVGARKETGHWMCGQVYRMTRKSTINY